MAKLIERVLPKLLKFITPELKNAARNLVKQLENHAKETSNPLDDLFVEVLKVILEIEE